MATPIVQPIKMYVDNIEVADATSGSYEINPGITPQVTDQGIVFQQGTTQLTATINTVIPTAGMTARLFESTLAKNDVSMMLLMDSKIHTFTGKLTAASANWDWSNGAANGTFSFIGSTPKIQG